MAIPVCLPSPGVVKFLFFISAQPIDQTTGNSLGDFSHAEDVIEAAVNGIWKDAICKAKLLEIVEPLENRRMEQLKFPPAELLVAVQNGA